MAMHCPQCLMEYRDGFKECSDCHVPLVPGRPPDPPTPEPAGDLVTVFETSDPFVVDLAKATLEDGGLDFAIAGDDADERALTGMPFGAMASKFQVDPEHAERARELLDPLLHPEPLAEGEAEPEA